MSQSDCPDCYGPAVVSGGNGKCSTCQGEGQKIGAPVLIVPSLERDEHEQCPTCGGSGVCSTCGGSGYVEDEDS